VNGPDGDRRYTRREVLGASLLAGAGVALSSTLAACGSGTSTSADASASASAGPKKGGSLRIGTVGGSSKETTDGQIGGETVPNVALTHQMYDSLLTWSNDYTLENLMAEEVSVNNDASVWTVRIKDGVEFHNGKTVTADDIIWSYKRIIDPKDPKTGAPGLSQLKASGMRKVDDRTVEFTLTKPNAVFNEALGYYINCILPQDWNQQNPVGTGPFKLTDFKPGEQFKFVRNENYFGQVPWVDALTIQEFADTTARVNALLSGAVDAISDLPSAQIKVVEGGGMNKLDAKTGAWQPIYMNLQAKPFTDVRVRQAFKLIPDRSVMIEQAYAGYGSVGNDMFSPFDPGYPKDLAQRTQDLEQAKSLLKQAGFDDSLTVTLVTSDAVGAGVTAAAQVFAEMAKGAGVTVKTNKVDSAIIYGDRYLSWPFSQDFWYTHNYLTQVTSASLPTSPYNATHWADDNWLKIVKEAFRTSDETKRNELVGEAQKIQHDNDGLIIWAFNDQVDGYSPKLGGVVPDKGGVPLSGWRLNAYYFV
jgi:peptide/nickel transport system substrate-binding protein